MNRRAFIAASLAVTGAACVAPQRQVPPSLPSPVSPGSRAVPAAAVRRLIVEHNDPILGRCRYVADTGAEHIARPLLVARRGERLRAVIENRLPQPTTVHFHGLTLPEAQDGAGFDPIAPGGAKAIDFRIHNRSGLYWFHPHPHGLTAEQIHAGLVGLLVVRDADDDALDHALALVSANRLALALSDAQIVGDAIATYALGARERHFGWLGNRALVNGTLQTHFMVSPGWVRLQLLNACNARGVLLALRDGAATVPFHLLGTDGGLLASPLALERLFLHPAERIDIAVHVAGQQTIEALSLEFDPRLHAPAHAVRQHPHAAARRYPALASGGICSTGAAAVAEGARLPLFSLSATGTATASPPLPGRLSDLGEAAASGASVRRIRLDFDEARGFLIDGEPYEAAHDAFRLARGTGEVWELRNSPISMPHPMHVHGFGFRVLRRQRTFGPARALATAGAGRLATDLGVKDTVLVWPNETVQLAVDFSLPEEAAFRGPQRYMLHCHNLEHEDAMMMRNFAVI